MYSNMHTQLNLAVDKWVFKSNNLHDAGMSAKMQLAIGTKIKMELYLEIKEKQLVISS